MESVAAFAWNGWQASSGISGNLGLEYAPSRARGLKPLAAAPSPSPNAVAPLAGAWIETGMPSPQFHSWTVAPLAGAWIETLTWLGTGTTAKVAPLAGAWIETNKMTGRPDGRKVAPLAGAWIET